MENKFILLSNSSCYPSLFDENMKVIPKRRNIRKARSRPSLVIKRGTEGELENIKIQLGNVNNKIKISLKESRETAYWLKILKALRLGDQSELEKLMVESNELKKILSSISASQKIK